MKYKIIDGKKIAEDIKNKIKQEIFNLDITISIIVVGEDKASLLYSKLKKNACNLVGINVLLYNLPSESTNDDIINLIKIFNNSKYITGIFIELPLPKHINKNKVLKTIDIKKDLDCLNPYSLSRLYTDNDILKPCTAASIIEIFKYNNINIESKNCTIIGRSDLIGKPLSVLMLKENATVTICHSYTKNIEKITKMADIIISAVGKINTVTNNMVKKGAIVIDIGTNILENGILCGDVDFENIKENVSYITPVPGGVGPITVAMFLKNCLKSYKIQNNL